MVASELEREKEGSLSSALSQGLNCNHQAAEDLSLSRIINPIRAVHLTVHLGGLSHHLLGEVEALLGAAELQ